MSKICLTIIALVFSFSLSVTASTSDIMAQKVVSGGFPQQTPQGIRILRSGLVEAFSGKEAHPVALLYLSTKDELVTLIESSISKLEDTEPQAPKCIDDFKTNYTAFRTTGEEVVVAQRIECHTYVSQNLLTLKNLLDGFSSGDKTFNPNP